jgi:ornithine cyclodeaminase/alanine dehydrogenase-like protein (mu-crystallin family)
MVRLLEPQRVHVVGRELTKCQRLADEMSADLKVPIDASTDVRGAVRPSDIVVTCTASRAPLFPADDVQPGTFIEQWALMHPANRNLIQFASAE